MLRWLRRDPKHLIEHQRRMFKLLHDYPVYEPPHRQGPNCLNQGAGQNADEYHRYIREHVARGEENLYRLRQAHRHERLAALRAFLSKFDVELYTDDAGLSAVSAWCPGNCGALVANMRDHATRRAFFQLAPWTGELRGLNVVFDLGVFLGECLIARNPKLHWKYLGGGSSSAGPANLSGYRIAGFRDIRDSLDAPSFMYNHCANDQAMVRWPNFDRNLHLNTLVGIVRDRSTRQGRPRE
jgi:hypothetical protein